MDESSKALWRNWEPSSTLRSMLGGSTEEAGERVRAALETEKRMHRRVQIGNYSGQGSGL